MRIEDRAVRVTFTDKDAYDNLPAESLLLVCDNVPKDYMPLYGGLGDNIDGPITQKGTTDAIRALGETMTESIVQTTGQATNKVMSQKAVTDIIGNIETLLANI